MLRYTTVFLSLNAIGVAVCCVLAKYDDPAWNIVAASMFGFGVLWFLLALYAKRKRDMETRR